MLNVLKLKGKIAENNYTLEGFSKELGMPKATFYRRLNKNQEKLSIGEAKKMAQILKLSKEDSVNIFFA